MLVAEGFNQLKAAPQLVSLTSAGQIAPAGPTPYFVIIAADEMNVSAKPIELGNGDWTFSVAADAAT